MARLVALGDAHLGRTHLAHLRDDQGRNLREEDFLRSFSWAIDTTIALEPDGSPIAVTYSADQLSKLVAR